MRFEKQTFNHTEVTLDHNEFVDCWQRLGIEKVYGMRFDPNDAARLRIRSWIDQHLELV